MNHHLWEPMVYRAKHGPPMKLVYWPHEGYWQICENDSNGVAHSHGRFSSAEAAEQWLGRKELE
jgi:hypothetical protein